MKNLGRTALAIAVVILLLGATSAFADTFPSSLTVFNVSGYTGPFGTVTVTTTGANVNTATITFDAATGYVFMDHDLADVNINATSFTGTAGGFVKAAGDTGTPSIGVETTGGSTVDGWGDFNLRFGTTAGYESAVTSFTFTVTDTSGTWASAADVLIANALGYDAAAHIAPISQAGAVTGFAAETGGTPVTNTPEPSSLLLLGTGLSILSGYGLRRRSTSAA
jgi:hypothetical protein